MRLFKGLILLALLLGFMLINSVVNSGGDTVIKNKAAVAQANGGDAEYVANRLIQKDNTMKILVGVVEAWVFVTLAWMFFGKDLKRAFRPDLYNQEGQNRP